MSEEAVSPSESTRAAPSGVAPSRVATRPLLWTALAVILLIAVACAAAYGLLLHMGGRVSGWVRPQIDAGQIPAPPRLETRPAQTLPEYLRTENARLGRYRWIDRDRGVVQIPIDEAMRLTVQRASATGEPHSEAAP